MNIDDTNVQSNSVGAACAEERRTLAWFGGTLVGDDAVAAERHVAGCATCRETVAMLAGFSADELDEREAELVDSLNARTAAAAIALVQDDAAEQRSQSGMMWFGLPRWMAAAAVLAVFSGAAFVVWFGRGTERAPLERGERLLAQATASARPTALRVSGQAYAPARVTRGVDGENGAKLEAARALFEAAAAKNPTPETLHALGRTLIATGDGPGAVDALQRALRERPADATMLSDLAVAKTLAGDIDGARADLDRALVLDPLRAEALFNRAVLRARAGDASGAHADIENLRRVDPASPWLSDAERRIENDDGPAK